MKKYQLYGIGNALVDKEFEVDDSFFTETGIEKGFMTLIEEEQQQQLLDTLNSRYTQVKQAGGGSAANTLYAFSQLGGKAYFSCKVANDEPGDFYVRELGHHNIETNLGQVRESGTTGRCLVMVTPDAERTMLTHLGISQLVSVSELDYTAIAQSEMVYFEGYLVTSETAKAAVLTLKSEAQANGVKTVLTFSDPAMVEYFRDGINEILGEGVDLLFCNEKEAKIWAQTETLQAACERLQTRAKTFAITLGARGALLFDGEHYHEIPAHKVEAVDTNGAGDMFAGAFLFGLARGLDFAAAGKLASLASATVVSHFGPRLQPEQHQQLLRSLQLDA
ncbi:MAG: adenosine kinase [Pseudomonadales bacterium]|nr:adenosine kinase [Pseudomonadales bacterium]